MIAKNSKSTPRKTRTKLRKPKYLSLRHQLIATTPPPTPPMPTTTGHRDDQKQLIDLFPLHPENLVEQLKMDEEQNVASMFSSCDDGAATTLTGILCSDDHDEEEENTNNPSPSSVNYADEGVELVRTAMKRNKTDGNESNDHEKWVCFSESSTTATCNHHHHNNNFDYHNNDKNNFDRHDHYRSKLVLKLDYEKVMNSWVNKGPFFIHDNSDVDAKQLQTVPDLHDEDFFLHSSINVTSNDEHVNGGSWIVPEITHILNNNRSSGEDPFRVGESSAMAHNREASVQRYKEKRRSRLFAKTVRYEVRKLNAEKRPRIKGRFVKSG